MFKQLTVFIENKPGRLEEVTRHLADENINLYALTIADTTDFGILRVIVSEPEKAEKILKEKNFMVRTSSVVAVPMDHRPGALNKILQKLKNLDISIEYMYAYTSRHKDYDAIMILRLDDQDLAVEKMKKSGITILGQELQDNPNEAVSDIYECYL